ncbi:hypothetical protein EMQU_1635 [Enterococcus mundtii QU 25]|nr:hypothetical protein EMQU_1635 [Enterococcus mundtii QU 25]
MKLTVSQVRKYRNDYIYTALAKNGEIAALAAEFQMSEKQILQIRNKRIEFNRSSKRFTVISQ